MLRPLDMFFYPSFYLLGFAEGAGVIFMKAGAVILTIDLKNGLARKVFEVANVTIVVPYMSFYTPGTMTVFNG